MVSYTASAEGFSDFHMNDFHSFSQTVEVLAFPMFTGSLLNISLNQKERHWRIHFMFMRHVLRLSARITEAPVVEMT